MNDQPRTDAIDAKTKGLPWPEAYRMLEKECGKIERELAAAVACLASLDARGDGKVNGQQPTANSQRPTTNEQDADYE